VVRVSVITISYNSLSGLKKTVQSVLSQDYTEIEHIIIDGNSIDGSKALINDYRDTYLEKEVELNFISEPDEGIYDAMNKGLRILQENI
jgi:glycosyltransferase involved in cell wall biosynthesis